MKPSKFTIAVKRSDKSFVLFSTRSRAVVRLDADKAEALLNHDAVAETMFTTEELTFLASTAFVVDDGEDEISTVGDELAVARLQPSRLSTFVALSTLCNFACVYCYETGRLSETRNMTAETLERTISWYKQRLADNHYESCHIVLFGGEPLIRRGLLWSFIRDMRNLASCASVNLTFGIITNGSLLTKETLSALVDMGLTEAQVTLDGPRDVHDKRRPLLSGRGTFDSIMRNLRDAVTLPIELTLRISFDLDNIDRIHELVDYLADEGFARHNVFPYFAPIHQTPAQQTQKESFTQQVAITNYQQIGDALCALYSQSHSRGFWIPKTYSNGPCMIVTRDSCLIAPDGGLYKCVEMLDQDAMRVGQVGESGYATLYDEFMEARQMRECLDRECRYVPMCGGGCTMESILQGSGARGIACHQEIFERLTPHLLRLKYGG